MGQIVSDSSSRYDTTKTSNAMNGLETNRNRTSDPYVFWFAIMQIEFLFYRRCIGTNM